MHLTRLELADFRVFVQARLVPEPGVNLITGANGAGKTSLLEAIYLLAHARSFRGGGKAAAVRSGAGRFAVFAEWIEEGPSKGRRTGLARTTGGDWDARVDSVEVPALSALYEVALVACFEPGSHELLAGGAEGRRRFLDWALFHVEQDFLIGWRRFQRALRQRNALLKQGASGSDLEPWEAELAEWGERLAMQRRAGITRLAQDVAALASALVPELGEPSLTFHPGWSEDRPLEQALRESRDRDLRYGHTTAGAHRADWSLRFAALPGGEALSRGQEKLAALCCVLGQASELARARGEWPVVLLDDLGSELDRTHQRRVWDWLADVPAQVLVTGTEAPPDLPEGRIAARFHVEQASVRRLL